MQPPSTPNNKRQIKVEMPPNPSATYANMVMISHTQFEVMLDFIQVIGHDPRARVQQRIVMTPAHAKMFLNALAENLTRYETTNGEIKLPPTLAEQLFKGIQAVPANEEGDIDDNG